MGLDDVSFSGTSTKPFGSRTSTRVVPGEDSSRSIPACTAENVRERNTSRCVVVVDLPRIPETHMISHVLADGWEVDAGGDAQARKFCGITNPREHQKLWGVDHSCAHDHLFVGGYLPPLTWDLFTLSAKMDNT
jgi:hypothetical protein